MTISVVIPMYNSSATIERALDSVLAQTYKADYEIIVVDDGSTDGSAQIVERYAAAHPKVKIELIRQVNGGAAGARNTGLRAAKGDLIAFNDSDDRWLPGKIAFQTEYFANHPEVDLIGGMYGADNFERGSLVKLGYETRIEIAAQVSKNYFSPPTVMFRRDVPKKAGYFNERLRYAEEGWFFNRAVFYCNCVFVKERFAAPVVDKARWGESGLSGNLVAMERGELFNITDARRSGFIGFGRLLFAYAFSIAKFIRRWLISKIRKLWR